MKDNQARRIISQDSKGNYIILKEKKSQRQSQQFWDEIPNTTGVKFYKRHSEKRK